MPIFLTGQTFQLQSGPSLGCHFPQTLPQVLLKGGQPPIPGLVPKGTVWGAGERHARFSRKDKCVPGMSVQEHPRALIHSHVGLDLAQQGLGRPMRGVKGETWPPMEEVSSEPRHTVLE